MAVNIELATSKDLPKILEIVNDAIANTTSNYNYEPQTIEDQTKWFKDKSDKNFPVYVATLNNFVIGFASYGIFREKIGYQHTVEHSVYIDANYRGEGVGKLLLQKLIDHAKFQNLHVMIGCIDASNKESIAFHEKFGFTVSGTITEVAFKFDRWLDLVIMQLNLKIKNL